jgi:hypothetical protein
MSFPAAASFVQAGAVKDCAAASGFDALIPTEFSRSVGMPALSGDKPASGADLRHLGTASP